MFNWELCRFETILFDLNSEPHLNAWNVQVCLNEWVKFVINKFSSVEHEASKFEPCQHWGWLIFNTHILNQKVRTIAIWIGTNMFKRSTYDIRRSNFQPKMVKGHVLSTCYPPGLKETKNQTGHRPLFQKSSAGLDPLVRDFLRTRKVAQTT